VGVQVPLSAPFSITYRHAGSNNALVRTSKLRIFHNSLIDSALLSIECQDGLASSVSRLCQVRPALDFLGCASISLKNLSPKTSWCWNALRCCHFAKTAGYCRICNNCFRRDLMGSGAGDLKAARLNTGWSQQEATARLGVSQPYYSQMERGSRPLPARHSIRSGCA
jgi:DNA-binding XRE family transcriptional regulator